MQLYDAHNHLQDERLAPHLDGIVESAHRLQISGMVVNGTREDDWEAVAALADRFPGLVIPSFGLHPWFVPQRSPDWVYRLQRLLERYPRAGVGEIGLDRWKSDLPWEDQEAVFTRQLDVAIAYDRPASVHCLEAWGPLVELLEAGPLPRRGVILHSFGGSPELVERLARLPVYFSFPGAFARDEKVKQHRAFRSVPLDRLLVETDAPDQLPPPELITFTLHDAEHRLLNHPANLRIIYVFLSGLLNMTPEALAEQVARNMAALGWAGVSEAAATP